MTDMIAGEPRAPGRRSRRDSGFSEFAHAAQPALMHTAWLLTGNRHAAEDAVQEALTRTYVAWRRVRPDTAVAYSRRILVNLVVDGHRRRGRGDAIPLDHPGDIVASGVAVGSPQAVVDDRDAIVRALSVLTPRERAVVVLRYYADLTEQQTAAELGVSVGTVKSTASRALQRVRALLPAPAPAPVAGADAVAAPAPAASAGLRRSS